VVRGLRTLATLAPISDEVLVYPKRSREPEEVDYAIAFAIPMNTPGLKIVCRTSTRSMPILNVIR
jgi:anthranilate 3-monooxygenase (FAD) / 4-hydroxyphenylacetate 3-monooxygenase